MVPFQQSAIHFYLCISVAPTGDHVISLIDEISYLSPPAPLLSQYDEINPEQFCNGDNRPAECGANCMCTHKIDIPLNAIVEIVLVDEGNVLTIYSFVCREVYSNVLLLHPLCAVQQPNLSHPFHLHGYGFNVIGIGRSPDTTVKKINLKHALDLDKRGLLHRQYNLPPLKDTIAVPNNGYVVLRFRADNPGNFPFFILALRTIHPNLFDFISSVSVGSWLFHCHFLYHIGMHFERNTE